MAASFGQLKQMGATELLLARPKESDLPSWTRLMEFGSSICPTVKRSDKSRIRPTSRFLSSSSIEIDIWLSEVQILTLTATASRARFVLLTGVKIRSLPNRQN